jgi:hypothetical protein
MTNQSNIEHVVMRRVHIIRVLRPIVSAGALSALIFIAALWGIGREVWVARVFQNMPHSGDLASLARFYLAAFDHTRVAVQVLSLLAFAALAYFVRETVRVITTLFLPTHA